MYCADYQLRNTQRTVPETQHEKQSAGGMKFSSNNSPYSMLTPVVPETTQEAKERQKNRRSQTLENKESNILLKEKRPTK